MNKSKSSIVAIVIIILLLIAGGIYYGVRGRGSGTVSSTTPANDTELIQNTVTEMLTDSHKVKTQADVIAFVETYYTPDALTRFQSAMAKITPDTSTADSMVKTIQSLPDPSVLEYESTIQASSSAVVTYNFKNNTQLSIDGKPQQDKRGYLIVKVEKDTDRWLIDTMTFGI